MKKFFLIIFMLVSTSAFSQWTFISRIPGNPSVNSISAADQNVIWVSCNGGVLYKTVNGGVNWMLRNSGLPVTGLIGISALDTSSCWVGTETGSIYHTSNGGMNWTVQFSLAGSFSNGVKMFNQNYGIYYGDPTGSGQPYQFRYTTNGGNNWLLSPNSPLSTNDYGVVNAWDWIDTAKIWLGIGNPVANATSTRIINTTSGFAGGVWNSTPITGTGENIGLYYTAIAFTDANNGMAGSFEGDMRKTTDGGITWTSALNVPLTGVKRYRYMSGIKDGSNVIRVSVIFGSSNYCFKTTNFGDVWTLDSLPSAGTSGGINQMEFLNGTLGYSAGNAGVFMRYGNTVGINNSNSQIPSEYNLDQNYPNPFNPNTRINFRISKSNFVSIKVYNALGKEMITLVNENKTAGSYSVDFDGGNFSSGLYYYTLSVTGGTEFFTSTKKMLLVK